MLNEFPIFDYEDIQLIPNKCVLNSRAEADTHVIFGNHTFKLPVVPSNMQTILDEDVAEQLAKGGYFYIMHRFDEAGRIPFIKRMHDQGLIASISVGVKDYEYDFVSQLKDDAPEYITIDIAHGHANSVISMIQHIKKELPDTFVIAGNVATGEATKALIEAGADCVKVGIGPGSICTTRVVAGIGVPQISAIMSCFEVARTYGVPIIADGGIKYSGDVTKALAAGGSVCMMGSLFAGCDEAPGAFELFQGRKYKVYRGMGSISAMESGSKDRYFQADAKKLVPEGVEGRVAYKGLVEDTVFQLIGGLRAGMGYCGAKDIPTLQETSKFVKITSAALRESHPHDIQITKEAPNYSSDN